MNTEALLARVLDKLDAQDAQAAEFQAAMRDKLGAIESKVSALEAHREGFGSTVKVVGWLAAFAVSLIGLLIAAASCQ